MLTCWSLISYLLCPISMFSNIACNSGCGVNNQFKYLNLLLYLKYFNNSCVNDLVLFKEAFSRLHVCSILNPFTLGALRKIVIWSYDSNEDI